MYQSYIFLVICVDNAVVCGKETRHQFSSGYIKIIFLLKYLLIIDEDR